MSLLRKIRRRHKAYALKRSTQSDNADGAAPVGSVEDGEDGDEDHHAHVIAGQADADKVLLWTAASSTASDKNSSDQGDVSDESLTCIHSYATKDDDIVNVIGTESQFWPRIAKTATLLLVSSGAFYIGKVPTVGITLCLLLARKVLAGAHIHTGESSESTELSQGSHSDESSSRSQETLHHGGDKVALSDESCSRDFNVDENNGADIDMEVNEDDANGEHSSNKESQNTLLAKKKQLKRLNCLKLTSSASPFGEPIQESPSSTKGSPRSWFRNGGVENSAESSKQGKFKSKALFRRLKKGEPHSAPTSPLWSDSESINGFSVISDGSDSERAIHGPSTRRKSKFRPASPVTKGVSGADANLGLLDQHGLEEGVAGGIKGEKIMYPPLPDNITMRKDGKVDGCPAAFCEGNMKQQHVNYFLPKAQSESTSSSAATSEEAMAKTEVPDSLEVQRRRGGPRQPVAATPPVSIEATARGNAAVLANPRAGIRRRGERKQQKDRVGTAWLTSGLAVITAGLLMGRIVAVAGLICYWYALSLLRKTR